MSKIDKRSPQEKRKLFADKTCSCGAKEGELHEWGCDRKLFPFCNNQLIINTKKGF